MSIPANDGGGQRSFVQCTKFGSFFLWFPFAFDPTAKMLEVYIPIFLVFSHHIILVQQCRNGEIKVCSKIISIQLK